jgi:hypothetical protein
MNQLRTRVALVNELLDDFGERGVANEQVAVPGAVREEERVKERRKRKRKNEDDAKRCGYRSMNWSCWLAVKSPS